MAIILALTSGDWNTPANWTGGVVPGVGDVAVMNGKTMTLPNGDVITCDKITSDPTLGLSNGSISLLVPTAGTYTFTINADLERIGAVSTSLVAFSTTSFTDKNATVNINGNITSRGTTVQSAAVLLNAASSSAPNSITVNVVGDLVAGGSMANSPALNVVATYANLDINITGNVQYEGAAGNYAVDCNNSQGYGRVAVSGYVMCSGSTSKGNVSISGTVVDGSYITVGAGIVPGGVGLGVSIARSTGTVINAAPDGVAIRPGVSAAGLNIGTEQASVTVNGDIMAGTSTAGVGILSGTNNTNLRDITVNGNLRSDTGVLGTNGSSRIVSVSGRARLTVNGDIDASSTDINSGSSFPVSLLSMFGAGSGLIVNGDIIPPAGGTTLGQRVVNITATSAPGMEELTVTGTVYGTASGIGIFSTVSTVIQNATIGGVVSNTMSPINAAYPAVDSVVPVNAFNIVNLYDYGVTGVSPLKNCGRVRFADTVVFGYRDSNGIARTASLVNSAAVIPAVADVRDGVAVGYNTGTLVVPQAANVLVGVVYDGGTVGTLSAGGGVDLSPVQTVVDAIKAKTDLLAFTANGVVADNGTDYTSRFNSLDTATAGIKGKTDQLTFTVGGVLADAGGTDYTTRFNSLDTAIAQIPTVTYTSRFNSIDSDLDNLTAGGGVDFTPVLNAIANVDSDVASVATGVSGIKSKTDQFTFGTNGVEADVAVSVAAVINYDSRFTALDTEVAAVKAKTGQLTFTAGAVNANATVDVAPIVTAVNTAITSVGTAVANLDSDLQLHDTQIKTQLTTIQNATGAIDLTPITTGLATVNANVLAIPTTTYTTRFNSLDTSVSTIISDVADVQTVADAIAVDVGNVSVDLTPVLTAVGGVQTSVDNISVDLTPVLSSVAGVQATANLIKLKTDTITPCDTSSVVGAVDALTERFAAAPSGPVTVIPQATATTTTLFGYCRHQNGTAAVGEQITVYVQQAGGSSALLSAEGQVLTSGADGLVACTVPRGTQFVYAVKYGNRIERVSGVDAPSLEMPSIIER